MKYKTLACLVFGLTLIDRAAKVFALTLNQTPYPLLMPWLELELEKNFGLAWNIGTGIPNYVFIGMISVILIGFCYRIILNWCQHIVPTAEALIIIGGLSNVFDRISYGFVIDFIRINALNYSIAVFNFADIYIALGLILMLQRTRND